MIPGLFITATGTAAGKTFITRGIARLFRNLGLRPAAIKPAETGVSTEALDARALALACARPELATAPGLYRAALPLAPYAVALETSTAPPQPAPLAAAVRALARPGEPLLVEGAGGLLVPLDRTTTMADLALELGLPLLVVAPDQLGVLSSVLTCVESARLRRLDVLAIVLNDGLAQPDDPSVRTNRRVLHERLELPVIAFPFCPDDDDALAAATERCGLAELLQLRPGA